MLYFFLTEKKRLTEKKKKEKNGTINFVSLFLLKQTTRTIRVLFLKGLSVKKDARFITRFRFSKETKKKRLSFY